MEADGVIWLPLPTIAAPASHPRDWTDSSAPQAPVTGSRGDFPQLEWILVPPRSAHAQMWSELMRRYHPLHSSHMAGAQLRYLAVAKVPALLTAFDLGQPPITRHRQPIQKLPKHLQKPGRAIESHDQFRHHFFSKKVLQLLA